MASQGWTRAVERLAVRGGNIGKGTDSAAGRRRKEKRRKIKEKEKERRIGVRRLGEKDETLKTRSQTVPFKMGRLGFPCNTRAGPSHTHSPGPQK